MRMQYMGMGLPPNAGVPPFGTGFDPKQRRQLQRMYRERRQGGSRNGRGVGIGGRGNYGSFPGRREKGTAGQTDKSSKRSKKKDNNTREVTPNFDSPEFPPLSTDSLDISSKDFPHRYVIWRHRCGCGCAV